MTTNNDILCRWRDALDNPPVGKRVPVLLTDDRISADRPYDIGDGFPRWNDRVVQWLDITDIPGVAREAVQAAVDEMTVRYWEGAECILHEVGERDHCEGCAFDQYPLPLCKSLACIAHHACVTPMEVTNG
jgi:hypothetical protein